MGLFDIQMTGDGSASIPGTFTAKAGLTTSGTVAGAAANISGNATAGMFTTTPVSAGTYASAMTIAATSGCQTIQCVSGTSSTSTLTPSGAGTAGQEMVLIVYGDAASGTVTLTFASTFRSAGTLAQAATKVSIVTFMSDGTNWIEQSRISNTT